MSSLTIHFRLCLSGPGGTKDLLGNRLAWTNWTKTTFVKWLSEELDADSVFQSTVYLDLMVGESDYTLLDVGVRSQPQECPTHGSSKEEECKRGHVIILLDVEKDFEGITVRAVGERPCFVTLSSIMKAKLANHPPHQSSSNTALSGKESNIESQHSGRKLLEAPTSSAPSFAEFQSMQQEMAKVREDMQRLEDRNSSYKDMIAQLRSEMTASIAQLQKEIATTFSAGYRTDVKSVASATVPLTTVASSITGDTSDAKHP
jgi:hypothetical protein